MASKPRITDLVQHHKKMAETFLNELRMGGAIPRSFSGIMTPKFGGYIFLWQFNNNKLVGSIALRVENADNMCSKIKASKVSIDWLTATQEVKNDVPEATVSE